MAAQGFNSEGFLDSDILMTHATAGTVEYIAYNDTNKNVTVHVNTSGNMTMTFPRSAFNGEARTQEPTTQEEFIIGSGESVQFRAVSTVDGSTFNVDSVFTRVRHLTDGTERHFRPSRSTRNDSRIVSNEPGRLIVAEIIV